MNELTEHVLFYTYANVTYSICAVPYAYVSLVHNDGTKVGILLQDLEQFQLNNVDGISCLEKILSGKAVFQQVAYIEPRIKPWPNKQKYVESKYEMSDCVYIDGINILISEEIRNVQISFKEQLDLQLSKTTRWRPLAPIYYTLQSVNTENII